MFCAQCGSPLAPAARFCHRCGAAAVEVRVTDTSAPALVLPPDRDGAGQDGNEPTAPEQDRLVCGACHVAAYHAAAEQPPACPFCGAANPLPQPAPADWPRPEALLPFALDDANARLHLGRWLDKAPLAPNNLALRVTDLQLRAAFVPVWVCAARATSHWTARVGSTRSVRLRDGSYTTTTDWHPLGGDHEQRHEDLLLWVSRGVPVALLGEGHKFDLKAHVPYTGERVAGYPVEESPLDRQQALDGGRVRVEEAERRACRDMVPGPPSDLNVNTQLSELRAQLVLVPLYVATYRFDARTYRCVVNGQNGTSTGETPVDQGKVWLIVGAVALVIIICVAIVVAANHSGNAR